MEEIAQEYVDWLESKTDGLYDDEKSRLYRLVLVKLRAKLRSVEAD